MSQNLHVKTEEQEKFQIIGLEAYSPMDWAH